MSKSASRQIGKLAGGQIGNSADGQIGKLAGWQIGELANRKIGSVGALSPTVVKLQNNRHLQVATLQQFWRFQTTVAYKWRRYYSGGARDVGCDSENRQSANRQLGRSGSQGLTVVEK